MGTTCTGVTLPCWVGAYPAGVTGLLCVLGVELVVVGKGASPSSSILGDNTPGPMPERSKQDLRTQEELGDYGLSVLEQSKGDLARLIAENNKAVWPCPYAPTQHRVQVSQFERHVADCARRYLHLGLVTCRFNRWHVMPKTEKASHEQICVDQGQEEYQDPRAALLGEVSH